MCGGGGRWGMGGWGERRVASPALHSPLHYDYYVLVCVCACTVAFAAIFDSKTSKVPSTYLHMCGPHMLMRILCVKMGMCVHFGAPSLTLGSCPCVISEQKEPCMLLRV